MFNWNHCSSVLNKFNMKKHKKNDKDKWQERALKETKKVSFDDVVWDTEEGIKIKPLYTSDDLKQIDHLETFPGVYLSCVDLDPQCM